MNEQRLIQFSNLQDFVKELHEADAGVVRVWPGTFITGGDRVQFRHKVINCQAIDRHQNAVLSVALTVGAYDEIYGRPFGRRAEWRKRIIDEHIEEAEQLVKLFIEENTSTVVRTGQIHTGLSGPEIQRAGWDGFDHIYEALKGGDAIER